MRSLQLPALLRSKPIPCYCAVFPKLKGGRLSGRAPWVKTRESGAPSLGFFFLLVCFLNILFKKLSRCRFNIACCSQAVFRTGLRYVLYELPKRSMKQMCAYRSLRSLLSHRLYERAANPCQQRLDKTFSLPRLNAGGGGTPIVCLRVSEIQK